MLRVQVSGFVSHNLWRVRISVRFGRVGSVRSSDFRRKAKLSRIVTRFLSTSPKLVPGSLPYGENETQWLIHYFFLEFSKVANFIFELIVCTTKARLHHEVYLPTVYRSSSPGATKLVGGFFLMCKVSLAPMALAITNVYLAFRLQRAPQEVLSLLRCASR